MRAHHPRPAADEGTLCIVLVGKHEEFRECLLGALRNQLLMGVPLTCVYKQNRKEVDQQQQIAVVNKQTAYGKTADIRP
jgi:hypothetical protein